MIAIWLCSLIVVMADMCRKIINWKQQKHQNKRHTNPLIYIGAENLCVNMYVVTASLCACKISILYNSILLA